MIYKSLSPKFLGSQGLFIFHVSCWFVHSMVRGSTGSCGVGLVLGKETLTKLTRSHSESVTVQILGNSCKLSILRFFLCSDVSLIEFSSLSSRLLRWEEYYDLQVTQFEVTWIAGMIYTVRPTTFL